MYSRKHVMSNKFAYAANELLAFIDENGGAANFAEKLCDHPEKYAEDLAFAVHTAIAEYEFGNYPEFPEGCSVERCRARCAQAELDALGVKI
jgi:hypothetical protein